MSLAAAAIRILHRLFPDIFRPEEPTVWRFAYGWRTPEGKKELRQFKVAIHPEFGCAAEWPDPEKPLRYGPVESFLYEFLRSAVGSGRYVNLHPARPRAIRRLFFDIEAEDLRTSWRLTQKLRTKLRGMGCEPYVQYTGGRGFHVIAPLAEPVGAGVMEDTLSGLYRALVAQIATINGSTLHDPQAVDIVRCVRIPYTPHELTGRLCVPVRPGERLPSILRRSEEPAVVEVEVTPLELGEKRLRQACRALTEGRPADVERLWRLITRPAMRRARRKRKKANGWPPCVEHVIARLRAGENLEHSERFFLTSFLVHAGWPLERIMDLFRTSPDFREERTRYQVRHIAGLEGSRKRYHVPSCRWLRQHGICPGPCGRRSPTGR